MQFILLPPGLYLGSAEITVDRDKDKVRNAVHSWFIHPTTVECGLDGWRLMEPDQSVRVSLNGPTKARAIPISDSCDIAIWIKCQWQMQINLFNYNKCDEMLLFVHINVLLGKTRRRRHRRCGGGQTPFHWV